MTPRSAEILKWLEKKGPVGIRAFTNRTEPDEWKPLLDVHLIDTLWPIIGYAKVAISATGRAALSQQPQT